MTGFLAYLLFPAISIALPKIAMTARFLRNSMLTEMKLDYVRTAYSKGCNRNQAPEQTTTNFMDGIHFKESMGNGFADAVYTLEYEVTAVQANNAKDAIAAELGVFPEFDENGTILSVSETR